MNNLMVGLVLVLIVFLAVRYIYKSKKSGAKCVGCPYSCSCSKKDKCE